MLDQFDEDNKYLNQLIMFWIIRDKFSLTQQDISLKYQFHNIQFRMTLNTPGFIKFWIQNDLVETKYQNISQIPIMNIKRQQIHIDSSLPSTNDPSSSTSDPNIYIVHCKDSKKCETIAQQLISHALPVSSIYKIPDQDSHEDFASIQQNCPGCLGKMVMNGKFSHPLMKFLKKNSLEAFYDFNTNSAKKDIKRGGGMFVHNRRTLKTDYYNEQKMGQFLEKIKEKHGEEGSKKQ